MRLQLWNPQTWNYLILWRPYGSSLREDERQREVHLPVCILSLGWNHLFGPLVHQSKSHLKSSPQTQTTLCELTSSPITSTAHNNSAPPYSMWQANIVIHPVLISPSSLAQPQSWNCNVVSPKTMSKLNITIPSPSFWASLCVAASSTSSHSGVNEQGFSSEKALAFLMEETDTANSCFPLPPCHECDVTPGSTADSLTRGNQINQAARTERDWVLENLTKLLLPPWPEKL